MTSALQSLTDLHAEWTAAQPLRTEDAARLWRKLRLEWNYHSNHIEGNTLTYGETELLLLHDRTTGNHTLREYEEMKAHDVAIDHVRALAADAGRVITEAEIRDLNRIILKEPFWGSAVTADGQATRKQIIPGQYKTTPNVVRTATGEIFPYASVEDTPPRMAALTAWLQGELHAPSLHPVETAARLHHDFVLIHPFDDGNGRVARLLVNYVLMRHGYLPLIVPTTEKAEYLNVLGLADAGDLGPMTRYLARLAAASLRLGLRAARGESISEPDDLEKELAIFIRNQTREGEVVIRRSRPLRPDVYQGVEALVFRIVERMRKLEPLFLQCRLKLEPEEPGARGDVRAALLYAVEELQPRFRMDFQFRGYRGQSTEPFQLDVKFLIDFAEFDYVISGDGKLRVGKRYSDPLLTEEIESISGRVLETAFAQVKKLSGVTDTET